MGSRRRSPPRWLGSISSPMRFSRATATRMLRQARDHPVAERTGLGAAALRRGAHPLPGHPPHVPHRAGMTKRSPLAPGWFSEFAGSAGLLFVAVSAIRLTAPNGALASLDRLF